MSQASDAQELIEHWRSIEPEATTSTADAIEGEVRMLVRHKGVIEAGAPSSGGYSVMDLPRLEQRIADKFAEAEDAKDDKTRPIWLEWARQYIAEIHIALEAYGSTELRALLALSQGALQDGIAAWAVLQGGIHWIDQRATFHADQAGENWQRRKFSFPAGRLQSSTYHQTVEGIPTGPTPNWRMLSQVDYLTGITAEYLRATEHLTTAPENPDLERDYTEFTESDLAEASRRAGK